MGPLHVVTTVFNPQRFASRLKLYRPFEKHVRDSGAELYVAEVAFGDRPWQVAGADDPRHLRLRGGSELWLKENCLNLMAARLPADWEYVAFVDADVMFARPDWVDETVQQLQHTPVVQMFSRAVDLGPTYEPMQTHKGFVAAYKRGEVGEDRPPYEGAHTGFAWAWRRDAFDAVGGLLDVAILGAGDRHMACSLMTEVARSYPPGLSDGYVEQLELWEGRARRLQRNVGFVPGTLLHYWHGKKKDRQYLDRWKILVDFAYDPEYDIQRNYQMMYCLTDRNPALRDAIREYFKCRNEDSIDIG